MAKSDVSQKWKVKSLFCIDRNSNILLLFDLSSALRFSNEKYEHSILTTKHKEMLETVFRGEKNHQFWGITAFCSWVQSNLIIGNISFWSASCWSRNIFRKEACADCSRGKIPQCLDWISEVHVPCFYCTKYKFSSQTQHSHTERTSL